MKVTDEVYREYSQMVYKYLLSLTGDAHVAEEVTQETFYQAVRCAGKTDMTPEKTVLSEYGRVEILRKLHQLDEAVREVMYLRIFGDLSFAQIGEITGRTENWARVTYYRGKEKLRKELDGNE